MSKVGRDQAFRWRRKERQACERGDVYDRLAAHSEAIEEKQTTKNKEDEQSFKTSASLRPWTQTEWGTAAGQLIKVLACRKLYERVRCDKTRPDSATLGNVLAVAFAKQKRKRTKL